MRARTFLSIKEWVSMTTLVFIVGGPISFSAIFQAFKIGSFIPGSLASAVLSWPIIRYLVARRDPSQAKHLTNYLQTAVSASGSSVGMGSMLLAYSWVTGKNLSFWEVVAIGLPGSLFGVAAANLFAASWINIQKLRFPTGFATGGMLNGLAAGGRSFQMLMAGFSIAVVMTVLGSPIGALVIGAGWIIGWEVMAWALLTALIFRHFEPAMLEAGLIQHQYREFTVYIGACMIMAAGAVDMLFVFFSKGNGEEDPELTEVSGFMPRRQNLWFIGVTGLFLAISMKVVFGLSFFAMLGIVLLLVVLVYIGATCLGKTDLGPVSALSGFVILLTSAFGKAPSLLFGAAAGQSLANGMDQSQDYRAGERVGSNFPLQRIFQVIGVCIGATLFLGSMYSLIIHAWPDQLTYEAVNTKGNPFDAGFAMKYHGFTSLGEKISGTVGTACLWTLVLTAIAHLLKNLFTKAGARTAARLIPSGYACSFAAFVGFAVSWQQSVGALLGAVLFMFWRHRGTEVTNPATEKPEPSVAGISWSHMIGIPSGFIVGESLHGFVTAILTLLK